VGERAADGAVVGMDWALASVGRRRLTGVLVGDAHLMAVSPANVERMQIGKQRV